MNLTTVALPNLIAHDLVIVHPMSSMSGFITFIEYQFASDKGGVTRGTKIADPFGFGKMTDERVDFTGSRVVEVITEGMTKVAWGPVVVSKMEHRRDGSCESVNLFKFLDNDNNEVAGGVLNADGTFTAPEGATKIAYVYDNVVIPQNDLPMVKAEMKSIALVAKARRIAVYYSQIAAFQAKTDYGVDLGDQLAEKAVGELSYEIDTEIIDLLTAMADRNGMSDADLHWSKTLPVGVSKRDHYNGFVEIVEIAKQKIYDATQKFAPNYMVIASNILPVLSLCESFKAAPAGAVNGPYMAGTLGSLKVFVSPRMAAGKYIIGCNGNDMMSSAAVYAPYMAVVPTQLLQYADGGNSQGFSTMYALEELNKNLVVAGKVF